MVMTQPSISGRGKRDVWDKIWREHWYSDHDRRLRRSKHKLDIVGSRYGPLKADSTVVEVGCGMGYFIAGLVDRNSQIRRAVGCDHSLVALDQATSKFRLDRVHFIACDAPALPFPDHSVDAAFAICSLEHIADTRSSLTELSRILKSGGDLFIFYSNRRSVFVYERWIRSLIGEWPYAFQFEITVEALFKIMLPEFLVDDWEIVLAESDFPALRRLDSLAHRFYSKWGRYIYIHATAS
jgi:ubiquinone/menaquinone biosynthesis C-methylase UbiE